MQIRTKPDEYAKEYKKEKQNGYLSCDAPCEHKTVPCSYRTKQIKMKLTKAKLEKILTPSLESMGYTKFKDTISGFQGLYVKKISPDLFLTLGMTISRYFNDSFTGNFYLSKSTRIGSIWEIFLRKVMKE